MIDVTKVKATTAGPDYFLSIPEIFFWSTLLKSHLLIHKCKCKSMWHIVGPEEVVHPIFPCKIYIF